MAIFAWLLLSMLNFELSRNRFEFFVPRFLKLASPKQNGSRRCAPSRSPAPPSGAGVGRLPSGERSPRSHGPPAVTAQPRPTIHAAFVSSPRAP